MILDMQFKITIYRLFVPATTPWSFFTPSTPLAFFYPIWLYICYILAEFEIKCRSLAVEESAFEHIFHVTKIVLIVFAINSFYC